MSQDSILVDKTGGVARITLNRPEVLNSFDTAMSARLQAVLSELEADRTIRALYLTGAGRAFCAGQDLAEACPKDGPPMEDFAAHVRKVYNPIVLRLKNLPKPIVCGVNGVAAGAGASLAFACDLVVASEEASFLQAFIKIGLVPDTGASWILPRLTGVAHAAALMMLGDKLPAPRALELGMIYKVAPLEALETVAMGLATQLAGQPTYALGLIKRMLNASANNTLEQQLELEADYQGRAGRSLDYAEGVKAFLDKRKPSFTGA
jgi:2-(1,2-epoxy-1,2-dihydrophenyl)acetyl-CoA isomerase